MKSRKNDHDNSTGSSIERYTPLILQRLFVLLAGIVFSVPYMFVKLTQQISQVVKNFSIKYFGNVLKHGGIKDMYRQKRDELFQKFPGFGGEQARDLFQIGVGIGVTLLSLSAVFQGWGVALLVFLIPELLTMFSAAVVTSVATLTFGAIAYAGMQKAGRNYNYYRGHVARLVKDHQVVGSMASESLKGGSAEQDGPLSSPSEVSVSPEKRLASQNKPEL